MKKIYDTEAFKIFSVCFAVVFVVGLMFIGIPYYNIYAKNLEGQANLSQQEWEKKIIVEEAKAEYEAAKLKRLAEVERAKGVAEANKIIGDSLRENENYLKYLFINNLDKCDGDVVYIPTEACIPILEANRLRNK